MNDILSFVRIYRHIVVCSLKKFVYILAFTIAVFSFFYLLLFGHGRIIGSTVSAFVTGLAVFFLAQLFLRPIKKSINVTVSKIKQNKDLITYVPMNYIKRFFLGSLGDIGTLYKDKLIFIPHIFNFSHKELTIMFSDIENIHRYKIMGIFNVGIEIVMNSGKTKKFAMDKTDGFYKYLTDTIQISVF